MTVADPAVRGAHVMRREDGKLTGGGTVRDPKTGEQLEFEHREHAGAGAVVWVRFPDGWRVMLARGDRE